MFKKSIFTMSALSLLALGAQAQQVVTVDGSTVDKTVQQITFYGDDVVLQYSDGTTENAIDMEKVTIVFNVATAIKELSTEPENAPIYYFDIQGRQLSEEPARGLFIMKKGKKVVKVIK